MTDQAYDDVVLADAHEQRTPCVLLLDTSWSMAGEPIKQLNEALEIFKQDVQANDLTRKRAEIAILSFGNDTVRVEQDFARIDEGFQVPRLEAAGNTPMGQAILMGLNECEDRKAIYRRQQITFTRPWMFVVTDGQPTDPDDVWARAVQTALDHQQRKKVLIFMIGVGSDLDLVKMRQISPEYTLVLKPGFTFAHLLKFVSGSLGSASASKPGEQIALADAGAFLMATT